MNRIALPYRRSAARGFTLIEVLIAISLLAVIVTIVYESLAAVTDATAEARVGAEKLRLEQFLMRNFQSNFSAVHVDPAYLDERFQFVGTGETGSSGTTDSVDFCSASPILGGMAPPGAFKQVHYAVVDRNDSSMELEAFSSYSEDELAPSTMLLESSESIVVASASLNKDRLDKLDPKSAEELQDIAKELGYNTPSWTVPVSGVDFSFYDGEKWVEDWDSIEMGRMPWCVRIRVNFARTRAEADSASNDLETDPDLEMYIPVAVGMGVMTDASVWVQYIAAYGNATGYEGEGEGEGEGENSPK